MSTRFRVLGPIGVWVDDEEITPPGRLQRRLLGALLGTPAGLSSTELCALLWGEGDHDARLHLLVHRTRGLLDRADRLERTADGYRLILDQGELDLDGLDLLADSQPAGALTLTASEPFSDCEGDFFDAIREGLSERLAGARKHALRTALHVRDEPLVLTEIAAARNADPFDEELAGIHLTALARSGRHAEALEEYESMRRRLAEELGVDPGPELRTLHLRLVSGAGLDPLPVPAQLPMHADDIIGREEAFIALDRLHADAKRLAVITGTAGVGKTAVTLAWAARAKEQFPDGVLYVDLRGFSDAPPVEPAAALLAFLRALGHPAVGSRGVDELAATFRTATDGRRMLVILDNARDEGQVRPLLPAAVGPRTVITSRENLAGLSVSAPVRNLVLAPLAPAAAVELVHSQLGDLDEGLAAELAESCARLPLAIVVAARAADGGARMLLAELQNRQRALDVLETGDESSNVARVLSWSLDALDASSRQLFTMLGLISSPATVETMSALIGGDPDDARLRARRLRRAHILLPFDDARLTLHDLLRELAVQQLRAEVSADDVDAARARLLAHYEQGIVEMTGLFQEMHKPSLLATLDKRVAATDDAGRDLPAAALPPPLTDAVAAAAWFEREHQAITETIVAASEDEDARVIRMVLGVRSYVVAYGYVAEAAELYEQLRTRAVRVGDRLAVACAERMLGAVAVMRGDIAVGRRHLIAARRISGEIDDATGEGIALNFLGELARQSDDFATALARFSEGRALNDVAGDRDRVALSLANMAQAYNGMQNPSAAVKTARESLSLMPAGSDERVVTVASRTLAEGLLLLGDLGGAEEALDAAKRTMGQHAGFEARSRTRLLGARLRAARGDANGAIADTEMLVKDLRTAGLFADRRDALRILAGLYTSVQRDQDSQVAQDEADEMHVLFADG